ncbi:MAG: antibiotic biosynthesis monooxygenase [Anaerolineales bacterium]|nr:antibiotic biosynthesis monooxygenase [Anaerolineales bacterium]
MIVAITSMKMKPGMRGEFIRAALICAKATRQEEGCIQYDYVLSPEDPDGVLVIERWESINAALAHMQTEHFKVLGKTTHATAAGYEVNLYDATPSHAIDHIFPTGRYLEI